MPSATSYNKTFSNTGTVSVTHFDMISMCKKGVNCYLSVAVASKCGNTQFTVVFRNSSSTPFLGFSKEIFYASTYFHFKFTEINQNVSIICLSRTGDFKVFIEVFNSDFASQEEVSPKPINKKETSFKSQHYITLQEGDLCKGKACFAKITFEFL